MSKIRTWTALLAACACGNVLAISNPDGLLTASSAAELDAAAEDGKLVFGRGMLKWTGGDGAVFAPSEADITAGTFVKRTLRLSNGAKLHVGAAKFMRVEDVYVDGVRQDSASVYTALNADWITSTSIGRVGMRAGTVLILR